MHSSPFPLLCVSVLPLPARSQSCRQCGHLGHPCQPQHLLLPILNHNAMVNSPSQPLWNRTAACPCPEELTGLPGRWGSRQPGRARERSGAAAMDAPLVGIAPVPTTGCPLSCCGDTAPFLPEQLCRDTISTRGSNYNIDPLAAAHAAGVKAARTRSRGRRQGRRQELCLPPRCHHCSSRERSGTAPPFDFTVGTVSKWR